MRKLALAIVVTSVAIGNTSAVNAEEKKEKLTLSLSGAVWGGCAGSLSRALVQGKVKLDGKLTPNRGKAQRLVAHADKKADLGLLARVVNNAETPHSSQSPPGVGVILAAKGLDEAKVKKAEDVLATIKGIDAKGSKVDAKKGEILVKLTGVTKDKGKTKEVKLTLDDIRKPLQKAGVIAAST